ncbi:hypothetical protein GKG03_07970 [Finegoldia sp. BIOML-A3]|uniref:hypothetical protein n=1 Tax=unclassified Finegoldia TaxID=2619637 RepID=UPI0012AFF84E|nr:MULTISPECIES: hypothetical protein [unclassified Finegoldia]MSA99615.1 hypothetical protein [Finegoldia sp. BIOML-A3]MSB93601.1 hypothetical protein [Finegoldia sp. BIOML-A4]
MILFNPKNVSEIQKENELKQFDKADEKYAYVLKVMEDVKYENQSVSAEMSVLVSDAVVETQKAIAELMMMLPGMGGMDNA